MAKAPTTRRAAREAALQALYTIEVGKQPPDEALAELMEHAQLDEKAAEFTRTLVLATLHNRR